MTEPTARLTFIDRDRSDGVLADRSSSVAVRAERVSLVRQKELWRCFGGPRVSPQNVALVELPGPASVGLTASNRSIKSSGVRCHERKRLPDHDPCSLSELPPPTGVRKCDQSPTLLAPRRAPCCAVARADSNAAIEWWRDRDQSRGIRLFWVISDDMCCFQ
jgi:hypothetical protein